MALRDNIKQMHITHIAGGSNLKDWSIFHGKEMPLTQQRG